MDTAVEITDREDASSSDTNLVITTKRYKSRLFLRLYWRVILIILIPIVLSPIAFIDGKGANAYKCFYVFLLTSSYWIADVMHPVIVSLVPITIYTLMNNNGANFVTEIYIRNTLLNCLGTVMMVIAIENCQISRRLALIALKRFGCSHYRLSFLLFFSCMFISMWVSNTLACGLMMPIVHSILAELEKMGILDMYRSTDKDAHSSRHEQRTPKPTDFTIFYFLGLTYSATIGGMATLSGSTTNEIFKWYFESYFPKGPKLEFPHFMLLNLPSVLLMEFLLYLWLNFYFMGMFRAQSDIALQIGMSEEELLYMQTLLTNQYQQMGRITFHEIAVSTIVVVNIVFDACSNRTFGHNTVASPTIACVILLFIIPTNLQFLKFFQRRSNLTVNQLPTKTTRACLNWDLVKTNMLWGVLFIIGSSCTILDSLTTSHMMEELERGLQRFSSWPAPALAFVVIVLCKILTEFAANACVVYAILPCIAKISVQVQLNPIFLMAAATISASLPFSLITGTPGNAMVVAYVHMPHYKMIMAGLGPTLFSIVITWSTMTLWSTTIFPDITSYPDWAKKNVIPINLTEH